VRQVSRNLDEMMRDATRADRPWLATAECYSGNHGKKPSTAGCSFRPDNSEVLPEGLLARRRQRILAQTLALQNEQRTRASSWCPRTSTCVSRRRPRVHAEDYYTTRPRGCRHPLQRHERAANDFWDGTARTCAHGKKPTALSTKSRASVRDWRPKRASTRIAPKASRHRAQDQRRHGHHRTDARLSQ